MALRRREEGGRDWGKLKKMVSGKRALFSPFGLPFWVKKSDGLQKKKMKKNKQIKHPLDESRMHVV